jgi:hypothetical protein
VIRQLGVQRGVVRQGFGGAEVQLVGRVVHLGFAEQGRSNPFGRCAGGLPPRRAGSTVGGGRPSLHGFGALQRGSGGAPQRAGACQSIVWRRVLGGGAQRVGDANGVSGDRERRIGIPHRNSHARRLPSIVAPAGPARTLTASLPRPPAAFAPDLRQQGDWVLDPQAILAAAIGLAITAAW